MSAQAFRWELAQITMCPSIAYRKNPRENSPRAQSILQNSLLIAQILPLSSLQIHASFHSASRTDKESYLLQIGLNSLNLFYLTRWLLAVPQLLSVRLDQFLFGSSDTVLEGVFLGQGGLLCPKDDDATTKGLKIAFGKILPQYFLECLFEDLMCY